MLLAAAFVGSLVASAAGTPWAGMAGGIAIGAVLGAALASLSIRYQVDQIIGGTAVNFLALGITGYFFVQLYHGENVPTGVSQIPDVNLAKQSNNGFFAEAIGHLNLMIWLSFVLLIVSYFVMFRSPIGLRLRSVGEHPRAADTVGISVRGIRWSAVLAGGIFGGLGGSFFTLASTGSFTKEFTVGNGFIALAAVIMGRWHPVLASIMCLFFGFVTQMASQLQTLETPMPSQFLLILPYVATIIAVAGLVGRVRPPAADGIPFEKQ
jgi:simple sugar transport system permease protein